MASEQGHRKEQQAVGRQHRRRRHEEQARAGHEEARPLPNALDALVPPQVLLTQRKTAALTKGQRDPFPGSPSPNPTFLLLEMLTSGGCPIGVHSGQHPESVPRSSHRLQW